MIELGTDTNVENLFRNKPYAARAKTRLRHCAPRFTALCPICAPEVKLVWSIPISLGSFYQLCLQTCKGIWPASHFVGVTLSAETFTFLRKEEEIYQFLCSIFCSVLTLTESFSDILVMVILFLLLLLIFLGLLHHMHSR